jgi:hypothetical protein
MALITRAQLAARFAGSLAFKATPVGTPWYETSGLL